MQHPPATIRSPLPGWLVRPEAKVRQRPETASPTAQGGGGRRRIRWRAATSCESLAPVARGHEGPGPKDDARRIRSIESENDPIHPVAASECGYKERLRPRLGCNGLLRRIVCIVR